MPVVIVTDTDVAAIPYSGKKPSFRLDEDNRGPFAAMLPLSELLDDSKADACKAGLRDQFAAIPLDTMAHLFFSNSGKTLLVSALQYAGTTEMTNAVTETLLDDFLQQPDFADRSIAHKQMAERLRQHCGSDLTHDIQTGRALIQRRARHTGDEQGATDVLLRQMAQDGGMEILKEYAQRPEYLKVMQSAKSVAAQKLFADISPAWLERVQTAIEQAPDKDTLHAEMNLVLADLLNNRYNNLPPHERTTLAANLTEYNREHPIATPEKPFSLNSILGPRLISYDVSDMETALRLASAPEQMATDAYTMLRQEAAEAKAAPGSPVSGEHRKHVRRALEQCPPYLAAAADALSMRVVIAGAEANINVISPNNAGMAVGGKLAASSTGQGIYVSANVLDSANSIMEEIIHEIDRQAVPRGAMRGTTEPFSLQPPWRKALERTTTHMTPQSQAGLLHAQQIIDWGQRYGAKKINAGLKAGRVLSADGDTDKNLTDAFEALPDMFHLADYARERIAEKGKITLGGILGGLGGKTYRSQDAAMMAAVPDIWQLAEGPPDGMKLVQHSDGRVEAVHQRLNPPAGAIEVTSLKEYCDQLITRMQHRSQNTAEHFADLQAATHHRDLVATRHTQARGNMPDF